MKTIKTILIITLALSMSSVVMARPRGFHRPPPRHYHHHHHHCGHWWIPATIFTSAVAASTIANASTTRTETIYVKEPSTTTVIYQNQPTQTQQKISREEVRPDGTRVIYYE